MKKCSMCRETKAFDEFHVDRSRADGRQRQCRPCKTVAAGRRRAADLAKHAASQRAWRHSNPTAARAIAARFQGDPQKMAARRAVHEAIRVGDMIRPESCQVCHSLCHPHAHHEDYDYPLVVRFLCEGCHLAAHGKSLRIDPSAVTA